MTGRWWRFVGASAAEHQKSLPEQNASQNTHPSLNLGRVGRPKSMEAWGNIQNRSRTTPRSKRPQPGRVVPRLLSLRAGGGERDSPTGGAGGFAAGCRRRLNFRGARRRRGGGVRWLSAHRTGDQHHASRYDQGQAHQALLKISLHEFLRLVREVGELQRPSAIVALVERNVN